LKKYHFNFFYLKNSIIFAKEFKTKAKIFNIYSYEKY
jgi:hypothetical protein